MALTQRQKTNIMESLRVKVKAPCPRCVQNYWQMQDELVMAPATSFGGGLAIGGPHVPMIQVICTNCGYVAHHAVGALGIDLSDQ